TARGLARLVVTPRVHGIHHANREEIRNVNGSSRRTVWDWLHGTLRTDVPQDEIRIGVGGYDDPRMVTLPRALAMPFSHEGLEEHEGEPSQASWTSCPSWRILRDLRVLRG